MAEVLSDFVPDSSRFHRGHKMAGGSGQQRSPSESPYRQRSRSPVVPPSPRTQPTSIPAGTLTPATARELPQQVSADASERSGSTRPAPPSPPSSSSPSPASHTKQRFTSQKDFPESSAPYGRSPSEKRPKTGAPPLATAHSPVARSARSLDDVTQNGGNTIKVRDLAHIQSFATDEFLAYRGQSGRARTADDPALKYEISAMPITDIIEMVAGLLTKITTTNDRQHDSLHRPIPTGDNMNLSGHSSSVLAFHGKNVPSITILSYLSRIHKYCPTTYEVFLSLLVYFDRMTERVNAGTIQALNRDTIEQAESPQSSGYSAEGSDLADSPPVTAAPASSRSVPEMAADLDQAQYTHAPPSEHTSNILPLSHFFVVDSFNIHRLVIAGVTCASKFFSDVFYTNSRYAKVRLPGVDFIFRY